MKLAQPTVLDFYIIVTTVRCVFRLSNNYAEEKNKLYMIINNSKYTVIVLNKLSLDLATTRHIYIAIHSYTYTLVDDKYIHDVHYYTKYMIVLSTTIMYPITFTITITMYTITITTITIANVLCIH